MTAKSNCPWAHFVGGMRFEAVRMFDPHPHWRVLNRTTGVLLPFDLTWASNPTRGKLLLGLDLTASTMGMDEFGRFSAAAVDTATEVTLLKREAAGLRVVGKVQVQVSGEFKASDALAMALHDLVPMADGHDLSVYSVSLDSVRVASLEKQPAAA